MNTKLLESEYQSISRDAHDFSEEMGRQLAELLQRRRVSLAIPIQSRVKTWESIIEKIERKSLVLDGIRALPDLIGIRLILLFQRDVDSVGTILSTYFKVISKENTLDRLEETQFGYGSVHFVVEFPPKWLSTPSLSRLSGLKAEVQVRTVAQHVWAAASHLLQYKQEVGVPPTVKRAIHRVSALLETVDLEFERVLQQRDQYKASPDISSYSEFLNVDSLAKLLDELLPYDNKNENERYADLLINLLAFSINTPALFVELIRKHLDKALLADTRRVKEQGDLSKSHFTGQIIDRYEKGVFYTYVGLVRAILEAEFGQAWLDYIAEYSRNKT